MLTSMDRQSSVPYYEISSKNELSLFCNLYQCQIALRRLRTSCKIIHPIIQNALNHLDKTIAFCLPVSAGDAKKVYAYILDILDKLCSTNHSRLALYFNRSPYWQHYQINMTEIVCALGACCTARRKDGHGTAEFSRKFMPMTDIIIRQRTASGMALRRTSSVSTMV